MSLAGNGYYYTPTHQIFHGNQYSRGWKEANGCTGGVRHYPTPCPPRGWPTADEGGSHSSMLSPGLVTQFVKHSNSPEIRIAMALPQIVEIPLMGRGRKVR